MENQVEKSEALVHYVQEETSLAEEFLVQAENMVLHQPEEAVGAGDWLKKVKKKGKELEVKRTDALRLTREYTNWVNALFKGPQGILDKTERAIKGALLTWNRKESDRIKAEQEAAEKKAEKIRKQKEAWASKAEERGDLERAEELRESADEVEVEVSEERVENPSGIYTQKRWKAEVTDKAALIAAVASGDVSLDAVDVNTSYLDGLAKRLQGQIKVPGVRCYVAETIAARTE